MCTKDFESSFLSFLRNNDEQCLKLLEEHESYIQENYNNNSDNQLLSSFLENFNSIIIDNNINTTLFQKVLNHSSFSNIYTKFKSSDVLVKACEKGKIDIIPWLVSMNVNINSIDNSDKTDLMYLIENGNTKELEFLFSKGAYINYLNKNFESALSILLKNMKSEKYTEVQYKEILNILNKNNCNFNIPIDNNNNTAFMRLLLQEDTLNIINIVKVNSSIDFSTKNNYGENATSLLIKLNNKKLVHDLKDQPTFDFMYKDPFNGNTLIMLSAISQPMLLDDLLKTKKCSINDINNKKENALIIATKAGCSEAVKILIKNKINCNQQDEKGNTALHYAVQLKDPYLVRLLNKHSNNEIVNLDGKTPKNEAYLNKSKNILDILNDPVQKQSINVNLPKIAYKLFKNNFDYLIPKLSKNYKEFDIQTILNNTSEEHNPTQLDKKSLYGNILQDFFFPILNEEERDT